MPAPDYCNHPISTLKLAAAKVEGSHLTVTLECGQCGFAGLQKDFLTATPAAVPRAGDKHALPSELRYL
jgi:hypothetical protein